MDRSELADFLRRRREQLVPADVGLAPGVRRRTPGLRRDEVALLAGMSTDYYTRLEQARGPHPSTQVLASMARALRLTDDQRDHLYLLSGQVPPMRAAGNKHVGPGLLHLLDKLDDTPGCVISDLGEVLVQNRMHVILFGDATRYSGLGRYITWRWFAHPAERGLFPAELVARLYETSTEFAALWDRRSPRRGRAHRPRLRDVADAGRLSAPARVHAAAGLRCARQARPAAGDRHPADGVIRW